MKNLLIVLVIPLIISMGFIQSNDQGSETKQEKISKQPQAGYVCPMHPEVTSDKPGKCPTCGMNLVLREEQKGQTGAMMPNNVTPIDKILKARMLLDEAKKALAQEGKYNCCIKDPCDRCALDHQSCDCSDDVKAGKAVCPDCYAGWQRGDGIVPGVKASKVKGSFHAHKH